MSPEHQAQAVLLGQLVELSDTDVREEYGIEVKNDDDRN